jgi:hypothetical protein
VCSDTMMNDSAENNSIYDNIYHEEVNWSGCDGQTVKTLSNVIRSIQAGETNPLSEELEMVNQLKNDKIFFDLKKCDICLRSETFYLKLCDERIEFRMMNVKDLKMSCLSSEYFWFIRWFNLVLLSSLKFFPAS